jgi:enhancer of yellow 2 transcription factor
MRLIECGWRDGIKDNARGIVREKGVDNVTVDDLIAELTPKGRSSVPDVVKKELLDHIKAYLTEKLP